MRWPTDAKQHAYMKMRQRQNMVMCLENRAGNWMLEKLKATGLKWTRQAIWGYRLFDFWNAELGIAVEVDGTTHNPVYDAIRDTYNYKTSRILVLRVKNFNEPEAMTVLQKIYKERASGITWKKRREDLPFEKKKRAKKAEGKKKTTKQSSMAAKLPNPQTGYIPPELRIIFKCASTYSTAPDISEYVIQQFRSLGYICEKEFMIKDGSVLHGQYINILATRDSVTFAIEIDKATPRVASIEQLLHLPNVIRVILLTGPKRYIQRKDIHFISSPSKENGGKKK